MRVAIMDFLARGGATFIDIRQGVKINNAACSGHLEFLVSKGVVAYDAETKLYGTTELGKQVSQKWASLRNAL